jgi:PAS domain S-box-containing protein
MDYRLRRHDGEYRWILDKGVPRFATDGGFLGYIGTAVDITERRNQEAALRESEERYREVVESQTDFVCRLLPNMTLTFINDAYCRFLGRMRKDLLGMHLPALMPESARGPAEDRILSAASSTEPAVWECEAERPDGSNGWQQWILSPGRQLAGSIAGISIDRTRYHRPQARRGGRPQSEPCFPAYGIGSSAPDRARNQSSRCGIRASPKRANRWRNCLSRHWRKSAKYLPTSAGMTGARMKRSAEFAH